MSFDDFSIFYIHLQRSCFQGPLVISPGCGDGISSISPLCLQGNKVLNVVFAAAQLPGAVSVESLLWLQLQFSVFCLCVTHKPQPCSLWGCSHFSSASCWSSGSSEISVTGNIPALHITSGCCCFIQAQLEAESSFWSVALQHFQCHSWLFSVTTFRPKLVESWNVLSWKGSPRISERGCLVVLTVYFLSLSVIQTKVLDIGNILNFLLTPQTILLIHIYIH